MWHSLLLGGPHARPFQSKTLFASVILSPLAWKFIGYLEEYSLLSHRGGSYDEWGEAHLYVRGREYILERIEIWCNSFCYCTMQLTKMCERGKKKKDNYSKPTFGLAQITVNPLCVMLLGIIGVCTWPTARDLGICS